MKWGLIIVAAAVLALGMGGTADAFHSGGVAECNGCHTMHGKATGIEHDGRTPSATGSYLLIGSDQSSTCLNCHQSADDTGPRSYHVSTDESKLGAGMAPLQRGPGGDFGWLKKTYTYSGHGSTVTEEGYTHGHSIVALDKNYDADGRNTQSPGGSYSSDQLACNSCHDPHGKFRRKADGSIVTTGLPIKGSGSSATASDPDDTAAVGVYRLLAGQGYTKGGTAIGFPGVPAAKAPSSYNATEATDQVRVAYGVATSDGHATWSNWCKTCHAQMHTTGGNLVHPVDRDLGSTMANIYNTYVSSGITNGSAASAYSSLVPFMTNSSDYGVLKTLAVKAATSAGPNSNDQVSCLSCHRAHASGWEFGLRWNMGNEFITDGTPAYPAEQGRTVAEIQAAYYDRAPSKFGAYQRVLCNKCHAKD